MRKLFVLSAIFSIVFSAEALSGKVVRVADGDTIVVLCASNIQERVRLNRIDAPEKKQAFGEKAKQHLSEMVFGKDVMVEWKKRDQYGRILGDVYVGSTNVGLQMVRDGYAWHYKHFDKTAEYAQAELDAREKKLGLWIDKNPVEPFVFRYLAKRKNKTNS